MVYQDNDLPKGSIKSPYIYTNFVSTVDGKVQVLENWKSYWPIGSRKDHEVLNGLRALSDVLIHGSGTAKLFPFVKTIQDPALEAIRESRGVNKTLPYVVLSNRPDGNLIKNLQNPRGEKVYLVTSKEANVPTDTEDVVKLARIGKKKIDLKGLIRFLSTNLKAKRILVEGGPTLFGSFLEEDLIDEIFLTIAPKIFGNKKGKALTLVESKLFSADQVKRLQIISVKQIEDELFLRYKFIK